MVQTSMVAKATNFHHEAESCNYMPRLTARSEARARELEACLMLRAFLVQCPSAFSTRQNFDRQIVPWLKEERVRHLNKSGNQPLKNI